MEFRFEELFFRPSAETDIPFICALEGEAENSRFIIPWLANKHAAAFQNEDIFHSIVLINDIPVGFIILAGLRNPNKSIEFMRVVIKDKGRGLGRKVLRAIKAHCFSELKAHRLWLDVKVFNERAKSLYESEGFIVEGVLRDCIKSDDGYESLAVLSILENEFRRA